MNKVLSYLVAARRCEVDELENLARTCRLLLTVSELVHQLQRERGASNIFLASGGERYAELRAECIAHSDAARRAVDDWLERSGTHGALSGGGRLYTRIAIALQALEGLAEIRAQVAAQAVPPATASGHYSRLIEALLALVFEAADVAVDPAISRQLIALFQLMQGKELAGRERALGAAAFGAGTIDAAQRQALEYLIERQDAALERFAAFADGAALADWQTAQTTLPLAQIERLRRHLLSAQRSALEAASVEPWFALCSQRIDALHRAETLFAQGLQALCEERVRQRRAEVDDQQQLLAALAQAPLPALLPQAACAAPQATPSGEVGPQLTQTVVDMLQHQSQRLQEVTEELAALRATLDERKLIERAKGLLMAHQGLSEEAAHRLLRQTAMNQNRRLADVAQALLSLAEILPAAR